MPGWAWQRFAAVLRERVGGPWRARRAYDLDVVDQWLLRILSRDRESTFRLLAAELLAIRGSAEAQVVESLLKLEELGLLTRATPRGIMAEERRFTLTRTGRSMLAFMPQTPRSPTIFYL
jgi:DNA-binding PadR family transcriptional regulator